MTEQQLLDSLSQPSTRRQGFSEVVKQYSEPLYWKIRKLVLCHDDANDILQNTFLKAWNNIQSFEGKSKLSTWLFRIAINESLDFLRKQKANEIVSSDADCNVANKLLADDFFDGDETQAQLQQAVALLPEVQRTVFTMRYFDDMPYSEISLLLGTSEGALKASYHLAVKKITDYFHHID